MKLSRIFVFITVFVLLLCSGSMGEEVSRYATYPQPVKSRYAMAPAGAIVNTVNPSPVNGGAVDQPDKDKKDGAIKKQVFFEPKISMTSYNRRLGDVMLEIGNNIGYTVVFGPQADPNQMVICDFRDIPLSHAIDAITKSMNYGFQIKDRTIEIDKYITKTFSLPDVAVSYPSMQAEMGGNMANGDGNGGAGTSSTMGGTTGTSSQNLKAEVTLTKKTDQEDGKKALEENIRKLLSPNGHYVLDWSSSTLIVSDSPRNVALVDQYIEALKASADKVVLVEATITEVTVSKNSAFGIDWNILAKNIGGQQLTTGSDKSLNIVTNTTMGITSPTLTITRTAEDVSAVLKALEQQGHIKVLSQPYIYARNLQPVAIFSGTSIPYIGSIQQTLSGVGGISQTSFNINTAQDGVMLAVRCQVRDDGKIDVQLAPVLTAIQQFVTFNIGGNTFTNPVSSVQQTLQSVTLRDGETIVIGGMKREKTERDLTGIPILSKIPVLGSLFSTRSKTGSDDELVIALRVKKVNS